MDEETWIKYPDQMSVREHLFNLEWSHPGRWLHFMDFLEENATLGNMEITKQEYIALMSVGIIRPVFIETSDEEEFYGQKIWSFIDHEYKLVDDLDDEDIVPISMFSDRVYALN